MTEKISRRDFLKLVGTGAATTAVLTGCGPASRYVVREPYTKMPEYNYNGQSTYFATTCRECAAGCGLVVRTMQGRAIKVEGNKFNPVNLGKTCARGQATLHGVYNPDRIQEPARQAVRGSREFEAMEWDAALVVVADLLKNSKPGEIAFLMGMAPDHLFDLVSDLARALGAPAPVRFGALGMFEARATLAEASKVLFGQANNLFFDIANADVTFSFGANFLETWISPVAYTRGFSKMRRGTPGKRGYLVHFEPRMSQTAIKADEWIPVTPGSEGIVALAIGKLAAEFQGRVIAAYEDIDVASASAVSGVSMETLERLARVFVNSTAALAIPGGSALGQSNGLDAAKAILSLNALSGNLGKAGGVSFAPASPLDEEYHRPANLKEMSAFIKRMNDGQVKTLFVHGVNPVFELPKALGFENALEKVQTLVSFSSFPDETAMLADYVLPDHTGLESWGYQTVPTGTGKVVLSGAQPVIAPVYNTMSTADLLLAAAAQMGGNAAKALPFTDEVAFIQNKVTPLVSAEGGYFSAAEINTFWAQFQQFGGWWTNDDQLAVPAAGALDKAIEVEAPSFAGGGEFHLYPFVSPVLGEAGANKPWLQEVPDPTTTVMWNSWVEINPHTAKELGLHDDDVVEIHSPFGTVEVSVYLYPAIHPNVIAIPFGQGHTAYGRYAEGRGINPATLLGGNVNEAGDATFAGVKVEIKKTGQTRPLSRLESRLGVYGSEEH